MTDLSQPIGKIKPQVLNGGPIGVQTTLVDDPVALVDDPKALVGSQTTQIPFIKASVSDNTPIVSINPRR